MVERQLNGAAAKRDRLARARRPVPTRRRPSGRRQNEPCQEQTGQCKQGRSAAANGAKTKQGLLGVHQIVDGLRLGAVSASSPRLRDYWRKRGLLGGNRYSNVR